MKLAKKMLAGVLALAIVATFALTAFAAAPAVSLTATKFDKVGDEITITVKGTDIAGLEAADLVFEYDAKALEYVSVAQSTAASFAMAVGGNPEAGMATFSFAFMDAATADSEICTLTFKVLKEGNTKVALKFESWDGTDMPANVAVTVKDKTPATTKAPETTTEAESTTKAPTTKAPTTKAPTTTNKIPQTGETGVAAIAGVMALAAVAFVATRKKDEE